MANISSPTNSPSRNEPVSTRLASGSGASTPGQSREDENTKGREEEARTKAVATPPTAEEMRKASEPPVPVEELGAGSAKVGDWLFAKGLEAGSEGVPALVTAVHDKDANEAAGRSKDVQYVNVTIFAENGPEAARYREVPLVGSEDDADKATRGNGPSILVAYQG